MTSLEMLFIAVVATYGFWFLLQPHPALRQRQPLVKSPAAEPEVPQAIEPPRAVEPPRAIEVVPPVAPSLGLAARLRLGLTRTRSQLMGAVESLFTSQDVLQRREQILEQLFETLIRCDVGVATTERLVASVKERLSGEARLDPQSMKAALSQTMREVLKGPLHPRDASLVGWLSSGSGAESAVSSLVHRSELSSKLHVVMVVGVNGVGKTTTTGKLAYRLRQEGFEVVVGAADTFRAAAVEQLKVWAERAQAEFVTMDNGGGDPAAVAFEAVKRAAQRAEQLPQGSQGVVCLVDTAGRLHNRKDLMEELAKVGRVMSRQSADAPHEVLLVVDATTGQNALQQARLFAEAVAVTGVVLTKLDGTAKGGVALALAAERNLAINFVGVGESVEDLQVFDADGFVDALFMDAP